MCFLFCKQEGVEMRIADHLSKEQKQQLSKIQTPKKKRKAKPKPKKKENLSFRDIEELMGTRRDTYERRNGATNFVET
jgi:hypothetical protein